MLYLSTPLVHPFLQMKLSLDLFEHIYQNILAGPWLLQSQLKLVTSTSISRVVRSAEVLLMSK